MSFCRITGRSRGLPKPNYFPLLAPISPADARRFCRVTGKAYGLPSHHYIPVILTTQLNRKKCNVTHSGDYESHQYLTDINYGKRKHIVLADYRYVFPVFDETDDLQKGLIDLLNSKVIDGENFVYHVSERNCQLVFPARLEAAVRDGDVRDVMLAKDSDTVLLKMRQGKNVSVDLQDYDVRLNNLCDGEGPRPDVVSARETADREAKKRSKKRKENLSQMTKIFETKERQQEVADQKEMEIKEHLSSLQKIETKPIDSNARPIGFCDMVSIEGMRAKCNLYLASGDWRDLVKPVIESWDWETYEKEAQCLIDTKPAILTLPEPCSVTPNILAVKDLVIDQSRLCGTTGFNATPCIGPMPNVNTTETIDIVQAAIDLISPANLKETENMSDKSSKLINVIPKSDQLTAVLSNLSKGTVTKIAKVPGLTVDIDAAQQVFLSGHVVSTPNGDIFVPGQTVSTPTGQVYVPGLTINTPNGPSFVPGFLTPNIDPDQCAHFVAGQIIDSQFVAGQTTHTANGSKFVEGQTVLTAEGFKFVPGVKNELTQEFVPGQKIMTPDGYQFIPGQTLTTDDGDRFIAGENQHTPKDGWTFVPGQRIGERFIAGRSIVNDEGSKFVPGQYVNETFVPGITSTDGGAFVPGINVETKQGLRFVDGQIMASAHGNIFIPGKTIVNESGLIDFAIAKTVSDMTFSDAVQTALIIDAANTDEMTEPSLSVYGHMVQTSKGIEFYPNKINVKHLPAGKHIPGKLIKQDGDSKFVPGIMENGGFIPGQVVLTDRGEQFIPGQVIETGDEGLKFVPGQVIETKSGRKFVPGQTVETPEGVRFVPGQIVHTKAGPTFIPGQVFYTEEEGERFVPGQVVDTDDGPSFVPGRVIENGDKVTFIPGQIVQTDKGPRFVAPDLSDDEGRQQFSLQSFLVTPEELKLLKPSHTWTTAPFNSRGELNIDARMLRQLSEAGMTIGRHIEATSVDIVLQSTKEKKIVEKLAEKLSLTNGKADTLQNMFEKIKSIVTASKDKFSVGIIASSTVSSFSSSDDELLNANGQTKISARNDGMYAVIGNNNRYNNNNNNNTHNEDIMHIVNAIVSSVLAAVITSNDLCTSKNNHQLDNNNCCTLYELISNELERKMEHTNLLDLDIVTLMSESIIKMVEDKLCTEIDALAKVNKIEYLKSIIAHENLGDSAHSHSDILRSITSILDNDDDMLAALQGIFSADPKVVYQIVEHLRTISSDDLITVGNVSNSLKRAIVKAVQSSSDTEMATISDRRKLLLETVSLAKAIGLSDLTTSMSLALENLEQFDQLCQLDNAKELLHRMLVMRKLSMNNEPLQSALHNMFTDPYAARKNPQIRELIRQSGVLTIPLPEQPQPFNSSDVPISYLCADNQLAVEDFLLHRQAKSRGRAFLIVKEGFQAVVPRDLSRDVLTGKCAYTVLDENGIRHFEPLHVFSALKLNTPMAAHRFSIYSCDMANCSDDIEMESVLTSTCSTLSNELQIAIIETPPTTTKTTATNKRAAVPKDNRHVLDNTPIFNKRRLIESYLSDGGKQKVRFFIIFWEKKIIL